MIFIKIIIYYCIFYIFLKLLHCLCLCISYKDLTFLKKFKFIYIINNNKFKDYNDNTINKLNKIKNTKSYTRKSKIRKIS